MENARLCIGDSFNSDCNYATIKHEKVEPFETIITWGGRSVTIKEKIIHNVYCNHPSREQETLVGKIEPYFTCSCSTCPMAKIAKPRIRSIFSKIADLFIS